MCLFFRIAKLCVLKVICIVHYAYIALRASFSIPESVTFLNYNMLLCSAQTAFTGLS